MQNSAFEIQCHAVDCILELARHGINETYMTPDSCLIVCSRQHIPYRPIWCPYSPRPAHSFKGCAGSTPCSLCSAGHGTLRCAVVSEQVLRPTDRIRIQSMVSGSLWKLASFLLWSNFSALRIPICNVPLSPPYANMVHIVRIYYLPSYNLLRDAYPVLASYRKLMRSEKKLVPALVQLMDNPSPKLQCKALVALKYLAGDREPQLPSPEDILLIPHRSVRTVGNCRGRWSETPPSPSPVTRPRLDLCRGVMCPQRDPSV